MSMGGGSLQEAGADPDTRERDIAVTRDVGSKAVLGAAIGTVAGAVVALVVLLAVGAGPDSPGFWIGVIGGGIAGGAVGGMIGGVRKLPLTDEWELTYDDDASGGPVRVAVHAADEAQMERAREVLGSEHPDKLERLGSGNG